MLPMLQGNTTPGQQETPHQHWAGGKGQQAQRGQDERHRFCENGTAHVSIGLHACKPQQGPAGQLCCIRLY